MTVHNLAFPAFAPRESKLNEGHVRIVSTKIKQVEEKMNGSSDEEYEETLLLFALSKEQKADEAKEVLDKANFCPTPVTCEFSFAFATASLYDLVFTCQRQGNITHRLNQLHVFKNELHLSTFIKTYYNIALLQPPRNNIYAMINYLTVDCKPRV